MTSDKRISIYQLATPNIDRYAVYSIASILRYARHFGHSYFIQREQLVSDMHINWTKIALLQLATQKKDDFSLLIDADTVLVNKDFELSQWVNELGTTHAILMTKDTPLLKRNRPNAGVILLKNEEGAKIVDYWMHAARNEASHLADIHPRNQRVYWNYVQPNYGSLQKMVSNAYAAKYHWFVPYLPSDRRFLFHFTQSDVSLRVKYMKSIYQKYIGDESLLNETHEVLKKDQTGLVQLN